MKMRLSCVILLIALLLTACGGPGEQTSAPTTDGTLPIGSTPGGTHAPTEPAGSEYPYLAQFTLEGAEAWLRQKDDTTMSFGGTRKQEISKDVLSDLGLDMEGAVVYNYYTYEGTFVRNEDTYEFPIERAYLRLEFEAEDPEALRTALINMLTQTGSSELEYYEKLLKGETVDVTEDQVDDGTKLVFSFSGDKLSYLEMHSGETYRTIYEFNDSGVVVYEKEYSGNILRGVTEFRDDGTRKKNTRYHENGQISRLMEYDTQGNCLTATYYAEDGTEESNQSWEYEYYDSGVVKIQKQYSNQVLERVQEYFENGSTKSWSDYYENGQIRSYTENDEHGKTLKLIVYAEDGSIEWMERSEHTYSDSGKLILSCTYDMNDMLTIRKEYDEQGRELRVEHYSEHSGSEPYMVQVNAYYESGCRKSSERYHDGVLTQKEEYYESGNNKSNTEYYSNGQIRDYYEYPDLPWTNPSLEVHYDEQGNILSYSRQEKEYHANGSIKSIKEYDQNGNVSSESTYSEEGHQLTWVLYDENGATYFVCRWEREWNAEGMLLWEREYRNDVLSQEDLYYDNGMLKCRSRFRDDTGVIYYYAEWNEDGQQTLEVEYDEEGKEIWRYEFN